MHEAPGGGVVEPVEPNGPRMQERDAGGRTRAHVGLEVLREREQLLAAVAQGEPEHRGVGHERRVQVMEM